jgi:small-conductance mechanosensitive channel
MVDIIVAIGQAGGSVLAFLPALVAALIILIIGWAVGRLLGSVVSTFLDRLGVDDALRKTGPGEAVEKSGLLIVHLFDLLVRWFIYLIAIMAAASVLQIESLSKAMAAIVAYLPNIAAFAIILIVGLILVDFFADVLEKMNSAAEVALAGPIILGLRVFLYFVVIMLALTQLAIDLTIIYVFIEPVAWGVGLGLGAAIAIIVGFGLKDRSQEILDTLLSKTKK